MNHPFVQEFKKNVIKEHLKGNQVCSQTIMDRLCYICEIEDLSKKLSLYCKKWFQDIFHFNVIGQIIQQQGTFEEVVLHSFDYLQRDKEYTNFKVPWPNKEIFEAFQFFCDSKGIDWNSNNQFVSFNTIINKASFRFTLIHPSLNPDGRAKIFIRSHKKRGFKAIDFTDESTASLLRELVLLKKNIVISGATGSGKTELLNTLLNEIPAADHIIVIEDAGEIRLKNPATSYLVSDKIERLKDFCSYALRMSPDRIVLGEIRSSEVIPFILSSNTGHKGMMSTIHANSAIDTMSRLSVLFSLFSSSDIQYQSIERLIHNSVEYVVHLEDKKVVEVIKIIGLDNHKTIFDSIYSTAHSPSSLTVLKSCFS